ncbi:MAG TPA: DNA starvation/stationary phase protection protein, partial [Sphingopyxis sp.]|nr:DNA starvation/stationary phase protection protein [Sphingopyxis sp.]
LNALLADSFALYLKTKNYHWHVAGPHFRELHLLFDEQAAQILATTDLIAERVRKNGAATLRSIGDIGRRQTIRDDDSGAVAPEAMIKALAADNRTLLGQLKEVKAAAERDGDIATSGLVDGWADETEQRIWFLEATAGY